MAWYYGTYSCGHEGRVNVIGKVKDRQWKVDRHFEGLCPECWETEKQKRFDEANAKAAAEAAEMDLPELTGTEKQVAWANTLRQKFISEAEKSIAEYEEKLNHKHFEENPDKKDKALVILDAMHQALDTRLLKETSARFWIDHQYDGSAEKFLRTVGEKALQPPPTPEPPTEFKKQALEDMTIRPSKPVTSLVAEIRIKDNLVTAKLPEKNEEFRLLVRGLRFSWENGRWERETYEFTGSAMDRATDLGVKLLAAGFPVRVFDDELQHKILAANYEPECNRWIFRYETGFRVWWRRDEDFYREAKRLPGSKWMSEKRSMYVPSEAFRELQDFAAQYQFRLTEKAQEKLIEAAQAFDAAMVADVSAPEQEPLPQPGSRPVLTVDQVDGEIDADLRDQD